MLRGIIFDMDGVIINSEPVHFKIWEETLAARGIRLDWEIYKPCIGATINVLMEILHKNYGIDREDESLIEEMKVNKERTIKEQGIPPVEGAVDLIRRLKSQGFHMAVASSSPMYYIKQVMHALQIETCFDVLVSGEYVKHPKPAPDIFWEAAKRMDLSPEECLVIEDSGNGCKAARAADMICAAYYNPDSGEQNLGPAHVVMEGYEEIDRSFLEKVYCHGRHIPYTICETERLILKEMTEKDIPVLISIVKEDEEFKDAVIDVEEEIRNFASYRRYMYEMCDMGYWLILEKEGGTIIGSVGFEPKLWNQKDTVVELGYQIACDKRRQGFAYEACRAALEQAENRGADHIYCRIRKENTASIKLAEKLGFTVAEGDQKDFGDSIRIFRYACGQ